MTIRLHEICKFMERWAPLETAAKWDNPGLQIGSLDQKIKSVVVSLDIDPHCLETIKKLDTDLVITHHPIFLNQLNN